MKYRDVLIVFLGITFLLSLGFALGVNPSYWYIPVILFVIFVFFLYKLYVEK